MSAMGIAGGVRQRVPWWVRVAGKILLSRIPVNYSIWREANLFKLGNMEDVRYAQAVFSDHFGRRSLPGGSKGFSCLELGPGDSLLSAIVARMRGAARTTLVDTGTFARTDVSWYRRAMAGGVDAAGLLHPERWDSIDSLLRDCQATYLTKGLDSLRGIPDSSVDFIWSHAVLEHVRRADFSPTLRETRRILKSDGFASHRVDLQDHLGGSLNHLRFSDRVWEGKVLSSSGFYTNRFRYGEILSACIDAGFQIEVCERDEWPVLPLERRKLDETFRGLADTDLRTSAVTIVLVPAP